MSNIVKYERFDKDGIELVINTVTGESFATISGYARMSGKAKSTISGRLQSVQLEGVKDAEIETQQGLRTVRLINEDLIAEWLPSDNPKMASQLMKLGVRVFMHTMAGFKVTTQAVNQPQLPPHKVAVEKADAIAHITDTLSLDHPRLAQLLIDHAISDIMPAKVLEGVRLRGVVEIAEDMGFKCDHSSRVRLGQFVASSEVSHLKQSEGRLCNGMIRDINCYPDTEEVREVVKRFFN